MKQIPLSLQVLLFPMSLKCTMQDMIVQTTIVQCSFHKPQLVGHQLQQQQTWYLHRAQHLQIQTVTLRLFVLIVATIQHIKAVVTRLIRLRIISLTNSQVQSTLTKFSMDAGQALNLLVMAGAVVR